MKAIISLISLVLNSLTFAAKQLEESVEINCASEHLKCMEELERIIQVHKDKELPTIEQYRLMRQQEARRKKDPPSVIKEDNA
jgi:hypothetical protein